MAEDVKIQLGIDMQALERDATQAVGLLGKAFNKQLLGGQVLGSGMAPTAVAPAAGQKDTIAGIINALGAIQNILTTGFQALAGGVYGAGVGGVGGGAGRPGQGQPGPAPPPTPSQQQRDVWSVGQTVAQLVPSATRMVVGGFHDTSMMSFASQVLNSDMAQRYIGPGWGAAANAITNEFKGNDAFRNRQYELFRDSGEGAARSYTQDWMDSQNNYLHRYGFSRDESAQLYQTASRAGADTDVVLNAQGMMGLGGESANLSGALKRAGGRGDMDEFANIMGVAVATGLERGRWGELVEWATKAAQSSVQTSMDVQRQAALATYVAGMGQRFQVGSPAFQSMESTMKGMVTDQGSPIALMAALQQSGGNYFLAQSMMQKGIDQGGVDPNVMIDMMWGSNPAIASWQASVTKESPRGDAGLLAQAAGIFTAMGINVSIPQLEDIIVARASRGAGGIRAPESRFGQYQKAWLTTGKLPDIALSPKREQQRLDRPSDLSPISWESGGLFDDPASRMRDDDRARASDQQRAQILEQGGVTPQIGNLPGSSLSFQQSMQGSSQQTTNYQSMIRSGFGERSLTRAGKPITEFHKGLDLSLAGGSPVYATADGIITACDQHSDGVSIGVGLVITRDDKKGDYRVFHLTAQSAGHWRRGDTVKKGMLLGFTYSKQAWAGTHAHIEQRYNGKAYDPRVGVPEAGIAPLDIDSMINAPKVDPRQGPVTSPSQVDEPAQMPTTGPMAPPAAPLSPAAAGASGPLAFVHLVKVQVTDTRVAVTKVHSRPLPSGTSLKGVVG